MVICHGQSGQPQAIPRLPDINAEQESIAHSM